MEEEEEEEESKIRIISSFNAPDIQTTETN